jgi:hypothetical protein
VQPGVRTIRALTPSELSQRGAADSYTPTRANTEGNAQRW